MTNKIEDERSEYLSAGPKTERRQSSQSESQRYASVENFALFLLKGMQSAAQNPRAKEIFTEHFVGFIMNMTELEINRIKLAQAIRKENKLKGKHHG